MECHICTTCDLQNKRSYEFNNRLTKKRPAASEECYCQQSGKFLNLVYGKDH